MITDIKEITKEYYTPVKINNMLSFLWYRETAIFNKGEQHPRFNSARDMRIFNVENFQINILKKFEMNNNLYNIYYSLAKYKDGVPLFFYQGYSDEERNALRQSWREECWKLMISYDWLIDIDCKKLEEIKIAKKDVLKIIQDLEKKKIEYSLRFSGCGFQIIIPYEFIPNRKKYCFYPFDKKNIYIYCNKLNKKYYDTISEMVDYNINDVRRVVKCPFSLVVNKEKTGDKILISKILTKKDLEKFKWEDCLYDIT